MERKYITKSFDLLKSNVPLTFTNGTDVYKELGETYIKHKVGFFILKIS